MKVVAVIPAFNESKRIVSVVQSTLQFCECVIVVNDGSSDNTSELASNAGAKVIDLPVNSGAGYATREGCDLALKEAADFIITIDADGQHNPSDIPKLLLPLINKEVEITFGHRPRNQNMPWINKFGGTLLYRLSSLLFDINIEDTQTGFHAFTTAAYSKIRWMSNRYAFVSEIVFRVAEQKVAYQEVVVETIYHEKHSGMKKRDGIKSLVWMILWKLNFYKWLYKLIN